MGNLYSISTKHMQLVQDLGICLFPTGIIDPSKEIMQTKCLSLNPQQEFHGIPLWFKVTTWEYTNSQCRGLWMFMDLIHKPHLDTNGTWIRMV